MHAVVDDAVTPRLVPPELLAVRHADDAEPEQRRSGEGAGGRAVLALAELTADPASAPEDVARAVLRVGRAAVDTGDLQEALDAFTLVRDIVRTGEVWAEATDRMARVLLGAGEAWIALLLVDQLVEAGVDPRCCRWLRAQGLAQTGSVREALPELEGLDVIVDAVGRYYDPAPLEQLRELCRTMCREA